MPQTVTWNSPEIATPPPWRTPSERILHWVPDLHNISSFWALFQRGGDKPNFTDKNGHLGRCWTLLLLLYFPGASQPIAQEPPKPSPSHSLSSFLGGVSGGYRAKGSVLPPKCHLSRWNGPLSFQLTALPLHKLAALPLHRLAALPLHKLAALPHTISRQFTDK